MKMNKKAIAPLAIGIIIIAVIGGLAVLFVVAGLAGFIAPAAGGFGCGLNMRIDSAVLEHSRITLGPISKPFFDAPIFMCNQYRTPVDIDANNFKACPGISSFCNKKNMDSNASLKEECWKQCARIQVDKLTDSCWTMAGSGKLNFQDTWLGDIKDTLSNPITLTVLIISGGTAGYLVGPLTGALTVTGELYVGAAFHPAEKEKTLRCYRFRIISPIVSPVDKTKKINYEDSYFGRSWVAGLNSTNLMDPHVCRPTKDDPMCSFGGIGVSHINDLGEIKYKINDKDITQPTEEKEFYVGQILNYNITDPRNQVCYITYRQADGEPQLNLTNPKTNESKGSIRIPSKYVVRSCNSWSDYAGSAKFMN